MLIVLNTLGCRSSGISLWIHSVFVKLLNMYNMNIAKIIKAEINTHPPLPLNVLLR